MKMLISFLVLLACNLAFAGPEDETCVNQYNSVASNHIPTRICVGHAELKAQSNELIITSYFSESREILNGLQLTKLYFSEASIYEFGAHKILFAEGRPNCGPATVVELVVEGQADANGTINLSLLKFKALKTYSKNSCVSQPVISEIEYL